MNGQWPTLLFSFVAITASTSTVASVGNYPCFVPVSTHRRLALTPPTNVFSSRIKAAERDFDGDAGAIEKSDIRSIAADPANRRSFLSSAVLASSAAMLTASGVVAGGQVAHSITESETKQERSIPDSSTSISSAGQLPKKTDVRYFIAGGISAAISHGVATPVDVVKTRIQAEPESYSSGVRNAALKILDEEGPSALLGGLGPTVVGYCVEGALKFGAYEALKPVMLSLLPSVDPAEPYLIAAVVAGALASVLLCPIEETRIRVVTDPSFAKGLSDGLPKLIREEGFLSTFSGIYAMLSKQGVYLELMGFLRIVHVVSPLTVVLLSRRSPLHDGKTSFF
uniref:Mitochondrial carrier protein n=1 Tax=Odontella aurita TaxID=265563 RepID=A0A7S4JJE4_9STRA|mmetsp:Transcript_47394/g.143466  ORF Transcript_47394/g.143466 Transcript_47394/m.143466 type:complete len:340 (+) Transcript_47394:173-1192(+)